MITILSILGCHGYVGICCIYNNNTLYFHWVTGFTQSNFRPGPNQGSFNTNGAYFTIYLLRECQTSTALQERFLLSTIKGLSTTNLENILNLLGKLVK
jgi:hypothetical protein